MLQFLCIPEPHRLVSVATEGCGRLVRGSGGLAGLELLKVPVADLHVTAVVVHALGEALDRAGAVVVLLQLILGLLLSLDLMRRGLRRAAAEETADGVADGGADSDTAERKLAWCFPGGSLVKWVSGKDRSGSFRDSSPAAMVEDVGERRHLRSSAGHLAKETGALRLRRSLLVLLRRRGHGAAGPSLLGVMRRGGGGRASRGARGGTSGRTLTRHCEREFVVSCWRGSRRRVFVDWRCWSKN